MNKPHVASNRSLGCDLYRIKNPPLDGEQALQVSTGPANCFGDVLLDALGKQLQPPVPPLELARRLVQQSLEHAQLERQRPCFRNIVQHALGQPHRVSVLPAPAFGNLQSHITDIDAKRNALVDFNRAAGH